MQALAAPQNQPQVGIEVPRRVEDNDSVDSFLGEDAPRRNEHVVLPALDESIEDLHNGGPEDGPNHLEDDGHLAPAQLVAVGPGDGDDEGAANALLQQIEQGDLQALRNVLGQPIHNNTITAPQLWRALKYLTAILPKAGPYRIFELQADYVRILERIARVITIPSREIYESAHCNHPLGYDMLSEQLQEITPGCPVEYGEVLDSLCKHMTAAASMMPGADGVFIFKDREEFASSLRSLASRLSRAD